MTTRIESPDGEPKKKVAVERKLSLFGQTIPFAQAFPMLAGLDATVWIRPFGRTEENAQEQHYGLRNPPGEHIFCPKKGCTNGGWRIGEIIRDMITKRETHRDVEGKCNGKQWMIGPKYRECVTHFTATIDLAYKPEPVKAAA